MKPTIRSLYVGIFLSSIYIATSTHSIVAATEPEISLDQFLEIAMKRNPGVDEARNQIFAAEGRSTQASSAYLPQLSTTIQAQRVHVTDLLPEDEDNVLSGALTGNQLIYDFGKTSGAISAANSQVKGAQAYLNSVGSDLVYSVKAAYYDVLAKHYLIDVANYQVDSYQKHYTRANEYFKAGVKSKIDVTNAEVELANSNLQLIQSKFGLKSSKVQLEKTIGTAPNDGKYLVKFPSYSIEDFSSTLSDIPGSLTDLLQRASLQRPDLSQAQKQIDALEAFLTSAEGEYFPQVGLNGTYNTYETDLSSLHDQWQLGVGLNWEFFSGFRTEGQVVEAKSNLRGARAQLRNIELLAIQEVTDSYHLAEEKRDSVFLADKILKLASENLALADERYKTGLGDMIEFNDAQLSLTKAKSNLVTTYFDYNTALASLDNAIGLFPDMTLQQVNTNEN